jgi:hypothetical protein
MGTFKIACSLAFVVTGLYVGVELVPVYYSNYEFADAITNEATVSTYNTKSEEEIRNTIFKKAQEYSVPLTKEQIKVHRSGTTGTGSLLIDAPYTVHIDLPGYPFDLHFDPSTNNKSPF